MSSTHDFSKSPRKRSLSVGVLPLPRAARWWLAISAVLVAGTWLAFALRWPDDKTPQPAQGTGVSTVAGKSLVAPEPVEVVEGPWGRLEVFGITISPPPESIREHSRESLEGVAWHFPHTDSSRLNDVLHELELPDSLIARLRTLATLNRSIDGHTIRPNRELVLGLAPEVRTKLYVFLHKFPENTHQCDGYQFRGNSADQWFGSVPLSSETKRLVTPLIYRHGGFLFFSDLESVKPLLPSAEELALLIRALVRESTLLLKLRVSQASDVDTLVSYWGCGGRENEVRPILESLSKLPGEQSLDVTQLLSPFARRRIHTYPTVPFEIDSSIVHDCHWTAFNFFSEKPDDQYGTTDGAFSTLHGDYDQVVGEPRLGDLVFYVDDHGKPIHSAVYIAADVVFAKNGSSMISPWMFLKLKDMDDYYPWSKRAPHLYRRKGWE